MAPLGHRLGPKWSQKRQDEGLKSDLGSSRGGQGGLRGTQWVVFVEMFLTFCVLFCILARFLARKSRV